MYAFFVLGGQGLQTNESLVTSLLTMTVEIACAVPLVMAFYKITKRMGFHGAFTVLAVLIEPVWVGVFGLGKALPRGISDQMPEAEPTPTPTPAAQ